MSLAELTQLDLLTQSAVLKCDNCGLEFDEDSAGTTIETHGFTAPPYEHLMCCPRCHCTELYEIEL